MNKVILMGRLTKDPELRYSNSGEPVAIVRYSLAVNKRSRREGEPDADFFNCTVFGKQAEFAERYFKKGLMILVVGRLSNNKWQDQQTGQTRTFTDIIVEEQHFAESKSSFESRMGGFQPGLQPTEPSQYPQNQYQPQSQYQPQPTPQPNPQQPQNQYESNQPLNENDGFYPIEEHINEEDLPF